MATRFKTQPGCKGLVASRIIVVKTGALSICTEIKWTSFFHWKFFREKKEYIQSYSSFLGFSEIIGKSLYYLFCPTSTILLNEIRGFCQPCLLLQIVERRLSQKRVNSVQKEHARPVAFCLKKNLTVPFD